jgi:hypothetical protein
MEKIRVRRRSRAAYTSPMNTCSGRVCLSSILASLALLLPLTVGAQPAEDAERSSILFGAFITDRDTSTRLDSDAGPGTEIDLEDDLGLETSMSVVRLGGYVWLGRRHRFDAALFDLSRDATTPIQETIHFGDATFEIDSVVETEQDLSIIKADYTFAAVARDRGFLGVTGGLYILETTMALRQAALGQFESEDITAPLPLLGLRGDYAFNDRITLRGAMQWFGVETEDVEGRLTDFYVGADYSFGERMAVGLAYNSVSMNIVAEEERGFKGRIDFGYDGLLLYFKFDLGSGD